MARISEEVRAFANLIKDKNRLKTQIGGSTDEESYLKLFQGFVYATEIATRINTRNLAGDTLIWNNPNFGIWNSYKWGGTAQQSFVLGHSIAGILGTSQLGSNASSYVPVRVVSPDNQFREYFDSTDFRVAASTTADWAVTAGQCDFTTGEIATSQIIALNNETYISATLTATGTTTTNLAFELRFDGINWESVSNGVIFNTAYSSTAGIEWRATASGNATLTKIEIIYST